MAGKEEPASPFRIRGDDQFNHNGMSLRDYFAAAALQGFLADGSQRLVARAIEESASSALISDTVALAKIVNAQVAMGAYALADAMIAARATGEA